MGVPVAAASLRRELMDTSVVIAVACHPSTTTMIGVRASLRIGAF